MRLTTCPLDCFDGCSIVVGDDLKLKGNKAHPITQGYLCHHLNHYHHFERIEEPRYLGQSISLQEALDILVEKLKTHAPSQTLYFKGSGNLGVMQGVSKRFFAEHKAVLASGSLCDEAGDVGICEGRGANLALSPLHVKEAEVVIIWGRNPSVTNSHMLPSLKGKTLIVINPVAIDLAKNAALFLQIKPKGDLFLALALCKALLHVKGEDKAFLAERTLNFEAFRDFLEGFTQEELLSKADVSEAHIEAFLELIQGQKVSILVGVGVQKYRFGHSVLRSIDALGALLGLFGKEGCGIGYLSNSGFGFDAPFKVKAQTEPLPIVDFGNYAMVFIQGGNPLNQMPASLSVREGIKKASCVVYFGLHENETSQKAHLVIPACSFLEKEDVKLSYGHPFVGRMPKIVESEIGISEYALTQKLLEAFGYTPLESEEAILQKVIDSNSMQKEGFLVSKSYEDMPYAQGFYTPSGMFEFLEDFEEEPLEEEGFFLLSAKQNRSLNSQFITDDYLYVPRSLGLEQEDKVVLQSPSGRCEYTVMPCDFLRDDCVLLYSGAKNGNVLTPHLMSQKGVCAVYQETKVRLDKVR
ncbi:molybdopterin-dependent oxidoreductase [Sulfurospirillum barnesii]|uniref:Anaerobic dehydrogenase, typically selenocysteine-containing n=1 Tax=Sulfurospirillum barnesii (strain ATCC 700032 / DSM 10660 / SES-3) TaxID=760154 RepID=I3XY14_SULBS|nr:molybdopterin-dependent oxidoreductase [Sulfurospirillum barnesii]AFL68838.1 anaerobic dehydrogenase, typically selenocysteine-containing [Sulfurospirillum barnesii SES-3]